MVLENITEGKMYTEEKRGWRTGPWGILQLEISKRKERD